MITAAEYGQTSWELSVQVDQKAGDESMRFKLRVKGDLHIGGLMLKLVEKISKCLALAGAVVMVTITTMFVHSLSFFVP